ncbi:uncharacterized protein TRAVEDRAFT_29394, partial [Trametes versicolor FP-101664 SS1]|uniref:uncharacterized protein n=1 Tax=Trametes versicolor (strain FP-101664) TaxID=717944 RepID=UPI000462372D
MRASPVHHPRRREGKAAVSKSASRHTSAPPLPRESRGKNNTCGFLVRLPERSFVPHSRGVKRPCTQKMSPLTSAVPWYAHLLSGPN